jgi:hypothetical protein
MGNFEDDFMDLQSSLISLCLEVAGQKVDKVYVYCSIEKKSKMFNAFFVINNKLKMLNQLGINKALIMQFLKLGANDLEKVKNICINYDMPIPTEMKMYYDAKIGKYDAQYKYEEICSEKTGKNAGEVFLDWVSECSSGN